jgi:hypothetical protein
MILTSFEIILSKICFIKKKRKAFLISYLMNFLHNTKIFKKFFNFFLILIRLFVETLLKWLKGFNFYVFFQIKYALINKKIVCKKLNCKQD